ncbi:unnamed protein product [Chrysoparadoxa australica]
MGNVVLVVLVSMLSAAAAVLKSSPLSFYERLGSPKLVVAPMVDQSEAAFRQLCFRHGADLAYTPMIHSPHFAKKENGKFREQQFDGLGEEEGGPLIAQFCGNNADTLVTAAKYIDHRVDAVDLNLGCPQRIAKKGAYGAFLLPDRKLCTELVGALADNLDCPVTAKVRVLPKEQDTMDLLLSLEAAGASLITVHGRGVERSKTRTGPCNWDIIARAKQTLSVPVVANGGMETLADVEACLAFTGADACMSSEALLENPALFDRTMEPLTNLSGLAVAERQLSLAQEYLDLVRQYPPIYGLHYKVKSHLFKMLYRLLSAQTDVRSQLADSECCEIEQFQDVVDILQERYGEGSTAVVKDGSWYRRHR